MSSFESASSGTLASDTPRAAAGRLVPYFYAATLFVSALLLFSIQPMFAKMVLPWLGGAPAVWSVAMVFFQTALLAGYCYAHVLGRLLSPCRAALFHLLLIGATAMSLPIAIAAGWRAPPSSGIALWLFGLFAVSIGLPFCTLSARRCCKAGSRRAGIRGPKIPTCSMRRPTWARSPRCSPIPWSSNPG
jgi:hypothetical protein